MKRFLCFILGYCFLLYCMCAASYCDGSCNTTVDLTFGCIVSSVYLLTWIRIWIGEKAEHAEQIFAGLRKIKNLDGEFPFDEENFLKQHGLKDYLYWVYWVPTQFWDVSTCVLQKFIENQGMNFEKVQKRYRLIWGIGLFVCLVIFFMPPYVTRLINISHNKGILWCTYCMCAGLFFMVVICVCIIAGCYWLFHAPFICFFEIVWLYRKAKNFSKASYELSSEIQEYVWNRQGIFKPNKEGAK